MTEQSRLFDTGRWLLRLLLLALVIGILYLILAPLIGIGGVKAPQPHPPTRIRLNQSWDETATVRFHHTSQGTRILPLSWFMALEQPVATFLPVDLLSSRDYLSRFGFVYYEPRDAKQATYGNPEGERANADSKNTGQAEYEQIRNDLKTFDLPVGFAIERKFLAPYADPPVSHETAVVGLTCAGCHTGKLEIKLDDGTTRSILIEGGSAMINISMFQEAVSRALLFTEFFPQRFRRFARNVLGIDLPAENPEFKKLSNELHRFVELGLTSRNYEKEHKLQGIDGGFSRTDALGLIGNRLFGRLNVENQEVTNAPVNFPHLWDTAWFDWVQYNASIRTPMARNVGEALGVGALVNLNNPKWPLYDSTVNVEGLDWMEDLLGGKTPFAGLQPPRWEDMLQAVFGSAQAASADYTINNAKAVEGRKLYLKHCIRCHLPPREILRPAYEKGDYSYFTEPDLESGKRFMQLKVIDLNTIGTDPNEALNFYRRVAVSPEPDLSYERTESENEYPKAAVKGEQEQAPWRPTTDRWKKYPYWSRWVKEGYPGEGLFATISAEDGLFRVTSMIRRKEYQSQALQLLPPKEGTYNPAYFTDETKRKEARLKWDRYRSVPPLLDLGDDRAVIEGKNKDWVIKANLGYRARPHDGVWATPPFLHNGAVPNLYQMLVPAASRSSRFYLGSTRFDPKHVGYETHEFPGAFEMDTSLPGNSNAGHEFRNLSLEEIEEVEWNGKATREERWAGVLGVTLDRLASMTTRERWERTRAASEKALGSPRMKSVKGVLGPEFTDEERWQIVEYLKTL